MTVMEITSQRGKAAGDGGSAGLAPEARPPADKRPAIASPSHRGCQKPAPPLSVPCE